MLILAIICWVTLTAVLLLAINNWWNTDWYFNFLNIMGLCIMLGLSIICTIGAYQEIQYGGIDKYLNKEIVIDKIEITYDSQNNPIDTTYYYARNGNKSQSKE